MLFVIKAIKKSLISKDNSLNQTFIVVAKLANNISLLLKTFFERKQE